MAAAAAPIATLAPLPRTETRTALLATQTSLADYLQWENTRAKRHEFYRGEIFAMVGARRVRGLVAGNLFGALKSHLKGTRCRAFESDMKLQVADSTQAFDRGLKLAAYRELDSLQEYLLVDPDTRRADVDRRNEPGLFELHDQTGRPLLVLASLCCELPMAEVFDGVETQPDA